MGIVHFDGDNVAISKYQELCEQLGIKANPEEFKTLRQHYKKELRIAIGKGSY